MTASKSFPWKFLSFVLFLTISSIFFYDLNRHGSWKKTQSVRTLKEIGVWEYGEKAWDSAHHGFNWTRQRIEEYAPGSVDAACEFLQPYAELIRDLGKVGCNMMVKVSREIMDKIPVVLEYIEKMAPGLLQQIEKTWYSVCNLLVEYWNKIYLYMTTEVFVGQLSPENMHKVLITSVDTTQKYAVEYFNWAYEKIQTVVTGK